MLGVWLQGPGNSLWSEEFNHARLHTCGFKRIMGSSFEILERNGH